MYTLRRTCLSSNHKAAYFTLALSASYLPTFLFFSGVLPYFGSISQPPLLCFLPGMSNFPTPANAPDFWTELSYSGLPFSVCVTQPCHRCLGLDMEPECESKFNLSLTYLMLTDSYGLPLIIITWITVEGTYKSLIHLYKQYLHCLQKINYKNINCLPYLLLLLLLLSL